MPEEHLGPALSAFCGARDVAPTLQRVFCCPSRVVLQFHTEGGGHEELVSNGLMLPPQSPSK